MRIKRAADIVVRGLLVAIAAAVAAITVLRYLILPDVGHLPNIAHAGGRIGGETYTNSIAAMDQSYRRGFRVFEVDFIDTSDGQWVCGHDWNSLEGEAPDLEEFLEWRRTLEFTPCMIEELVDWFGEHPDALLVSDPKADPLAMNLYLHDLLGVRLIAQAYSVEEVCLLRDAGIEGVYLTFYRLPFSVSRLRDELSHPCLAGNGPDAVVLPFGRALFGHAVVAKTVSGRPVVVHTIDNCPLYHFARFIGADAVMSGVLEPGSCWL